MVVLLSAPTLWTQPLSGFPKYRVTVVAIKRRGQDFTCATAETVIADGDTVIVSGRVRDTERFSELS